MFRQFACYFDNMVLGIVIWMCSLPLMGLFVLPFFGLKASLIAAVALLIAILVICRDICTWKIFKS